MTTKGRDRTVRSRMVTRIRGAVRVVEEKGRLV
ncbi:hypothetical protein A2U01_0107762, partial [Trifolium medium]|nr:hypothetical protein [Trifolium medium]